MPRKKKENNDVVSKDKKEQDKLISLPTAEDYEKTAAIHDPMIRDHCEPKYLCPVENCDGIMCRNAMYVYKSQKTMYGYRCNKCGNVELHNY